MRPARLATGRNVLLALLAFAGLLTVMTVAATAFHDATGAGIVNLAGGRNSADTRTGGFTADTVYTWLTTYGPDGRTNHLLILLLDLPLIISAVAFTWLGLYHAAGRLGAPAWLRTTFTVIALAGGVLNLVEDAAVATLLLAYPRRLDALASGVSTINTGKSAAYGLAVLCTVVALAAGAARRRPTAIARSATDPAGAR